MLLQFIRTRDEDVTESVVRRATYGMKEADATVISVVNNLFNPLSRKRVKELALSDEEEARYVLRLSREIESSGRDSTIASG
jgi:chromosome transmission fidelity protein 18